MKRVIIFAGATIAALSFSPLALSQIDIRGRGVTGDVNQSNQTTTQQGTGNQANTQSGTTNQSTQQSGTGNQATEQSGTSNQATTQQGKDNQSTSQMGSSNQSTSQQGGRDQTAQQSRSGDSDNPNVHRDAKGREHENKGKHKGWANKEDRDQQSSRADESRQRRY
jgi:hypothetical protein